MIDIEDIAEKFCAKSLCSDFSTDDIACIRENLTTWYRKERRKLPWRGDTVDGYPDPPPPSAYGTWVSEVMLQQTRVDTVISYWHAWMKAFPTVEALASASQDEVNAKWSGLGYYRRARALREGAVKIVAEYNSEVPSTRDKLLTIPGIGPYTAGAISSIAFGNDDAIVDGNVIRVFSRLRAIDRLPNASAAAIDKIYWKLAADMVAGVTRAGDLNQAIMELGATVCKPVTPSCSTCPVQEVCRAYHLVQHHDVLSAVYPNIPNTVSYFPVKPPKKAPRELHLHIYAMKRLDTNQWLFVRRPVTGLLAGQFELPGEEVDESEEECTMHEWNDQRNEITAFFLRVFDMKLVGTTDVSSQCDDDAYIIESARVLQDPVKHIFSHQVHHMHVYEISIRTCRSSNATTTSDAREASWMTLSELESFGVTTGVKKVLKMLNSTGGGNAKRKAAATSTKATKLTKIEGSKKVMDAFLNKDR